MCNIRPSVIVATSDFKSNKNKVLEEWLNKPTYTVDGIIIE